MSFLHVYLLTQDILIGEERLLGIAIDLHVPLCHVVQPVYNALLQIEQLIHVHVH